jgi:hypothetical protein
VRKRATQSHSFSDKSGTVPIKRRSESIDREPLESAGAMDGCRACTRSAVLCGHRDHSRLERLGAGS